MKVESCLEKNPAFNMVIDFGIECKIFSPTGFCFHFSEFFQFFGKPNEK